MPVFVSEWGLWDDAYMSFNGGGGDWRLDVDDVKVAPWLNWLDSEQLSWVMWAVDDQMEPSAFLQAGASFTGGWDYDLDLRSAGKYAYDLFQTY